MVQIHSPRPFILPMSQAAHWNQQFKGTRIVVERMVRDQEIG